MSTRRNNEMPPGIAIILIVGVSVIGGLIACNLLQPSSPLRTVDVGTTGEMYFVVLAYGLPIITIIGVLIYLYSRTRSR